jgi:hypothetical protein
LNDKVKEDEVGGASSTNGGEEERVCIIDGVTRGKPNCRWVDNIWMDLGEVGWGGVDWIGLAHGNELSGSIKCWETIEWLHNWWPLD